MKSFVITLFWVFFISNAFTQSGNIILDVDTLNGEIWVLDSTHVYGDLPSKGFLLLRRDLITGRNSEGKVTSKLSMDRDAETNKWIKDTRFTQTYYENGNLKEYKLQRFDDLHNIWVDSIQYKKYDKNGHLVIDILRGYNYSLGSYSFGNKKVKKYDPESKLLFEIKMKWNFIDSSWINKTKTVFEYYSNRELKDKVYQEWSEDIGKWINKDKDSWVYNSGGLIVNYVSFIWDNGEWKNLLRKIIKYTSDSQTESILNQNWNASLDEWENYIQNIYSYNAGKNIKVVRQLWIPASSTWFDYSVSLYKYEEGLIVEYKNFSYSQDTTINTSGMKIMYNYNQNKKVSLKTYLRFDPVNIDWENYKKYSFSYESGKTTISSIWDTINDEWINYLFYQYILDDAGHTISTLSKKWDLESGKWENSSKTEKEYDDFNHLIQTDESKWDKMSESWKLKTRYHYFWNRFITGTADISIINNFAFYPNPAHDILHLSCDCIGENAIVEIFTLRGIKIAEFLVNSELDINVSDLDMGSYILRLNTKNGYLLKIFVIER